MIDFVRDILYIIVVYLDSWVAMRPNIFLPTTPPPSLDKL